MCLAPLYPLRLAEVFPISKKLHAYQEGKSYLFHLSFYRISRNLYFLHALLRASQLNSTVCVSDSIFFCSTRVKKGLFNDHPPSRLTYTQSRFIIQTKKVGNNTSNVDKERNSIFNGLETELVVLGQGKAGGRLK